MLLHLQLKRNVESSIIIALSSHIIYDIVILCCNADVRHFLQFFLCYVKKRNKFLKTDFPVCLLPALECLNGRMDETLCFLLSERKGNFLKLCRMSGIATNNKRQYFCKKSDCNKFLFENTCEDILNLSKVVRNKNNNLPAIQQHFCVAIPDIRHNTLLIFQSSFSQKLIKLLSSTLK